MILTYILLRLQSLGNFFFRSIFQWLVLKPFDYSSEITSKLKRIQSFLKITCFQQGVVLSMHVRKCSTLVFIRYKIPIISVMPIK